MFVPLKSISEKKVYLSIYYTLTHFLVIFKITNIDPVTGHCRIVENNEETEVK